MVGPVLAAVILGDEGAHVLSAAMQWGEFPVMR
jgi:hypothetical protein